MPRAVYTAEIAEMAEMMTAEMKSMQEQHSVAVALHQLDSEALSKSMQRNEALEVTSQTCSVTHLLHEIFHGSELLYMSAN